MRLHNLLRFIVSKPALQQYSNVLLIAGFAVLLLWPALHNGYPLVYSDSGTYISSGFDFKVPHDRPIIYGLFIQLTLFYNSLWCVIITQAILTSIILYAFIASWIPDIKQRNTTFIVSALILLTCTGLPWYCSAILTEIFTPWSVLLMVLLLCKPLPLLSKILLGCLVVAFNLTHLANILSGVVLSVVLLLVSFIPKQQLIKPKQSLLLVALCIFSIGSMLVINKSLDGEWRLSKSSPVFLTGKMMENGIMKTYLDNECVHQKLNLCAYKDSLPVRSSTFLWDPKSPLYALGGFDSNTAEYKSILYTIFTTQPYLGMFINESVKATLLQLSLNTYGEEFIPYPNPTDPPYVEVERHFKQELPQYISAHQHTIIFDLQQLKVWSKFQTFLILISIGLMILLAVKRKISPAFLSAWTILVFFYLSNSTQAAINAFSARHNTKISWLFILFAIIALSNYISQLRESRLSQKSNTK